MAIIVTIRGVRKKDEGAAKGIATDSVNTFASKGAVINVVFLPAEVTGISVSIAKNGCGLMQHEVLLAERIRDALGHLDPEVVSVMSNIWLQGWKPDNVSVMLCDDWTRTSVQFSYIPRVSEATVQAVLT